MQCCYHEKLRSATHTAIASYLLKRCPFQNFTYKACSQGNIFTSIVSLIIMRHDNKEHLKKIKITSLCDILIGNTVWKVSVFGFFWVVFSRVRTEYGPEKCRTWTPFTQGKREPSNSQRNNVGVIFDIIRPRYIWTLYFLVYFCVPYTDTNCPWIRFNTLDISEKRPVTITNVLL